MIAEGYRTDLLPGEPPPTRWISGEVMAAAEKKEGLERMSILWTYAILAAIQEGGLRFRATRRLWWFGDFPALHLPVFSSFFARVSIGLCQIPDEQGKSQFGISLLVPSDNEYFTTAIKAGTAWLPGADFFTFPVAIIPYSNEELHSSALPNPSLGLSTCWASDANSRVGILTAKHTVNGHMAGSPIPMNYGHGKSSGILIAKAHGAVDAAFIEVKDIDASILPMAPLAEQIYPAMSTAVSVHTANGIKQNSIETVTWTHSVFNNHNFHVTVYLKNHYSSGDSGGLVQDAATGDGIAIYCGQLEVPTTGTDPANPTPGILGTSQHLHQARILLDLSLFL